jgi:hypothetical protein
MAQPLRERSDVAGQLGRPRLGLPLKPQLYDKLAVQTTMADAADVLHGDPAALELDQAEEVEAEIHRRAREEGVSPRP